MRRTTALIVLTMLASLLAIAPAGAVGIVSDTINIRLPQGDNDAVRVALRFSRASFGDGGADRVLIATDGAFADALASGTLQGGDTPLLLTPTDDLRSDVADEIERLGATQATVLGGTQAISEQVTDELEAMDIAVTRIAGPTRLETAVEIAEQAPNATTALLSRAGGAEGDLSQGFADALAGGAWAADQGWPVLLSNFSSLPDTTRAHIADSNIETVIVLGGEAAISNDVVNELTDLGVTVDRVSGPSRVATAEAIAIRRGFNAAADANVVVLAEGYAPDAWAAGFSAAVFSARFNAPVLLTNGDSLTPETHLWLQRDPFDGSDITQPVLICASAPAACDAARNLMGLPAEATITVDEPVGGVPSRSILTGTIAVSSPTATVTVSGPCVDGGLVDTAEDGTFQLDVIGQPGACTLVFEIVFDNGTVQQVFVSIIVTDALPLTGTIIDTETGGNAYTFVPAGRNEVITVNYTAEDVYEVRGEPATVGAFEERLSIADTITWQPDTPDGTIHILTDVEVSSITSGTVGDVDLSQGTYAFIEPVTATPLRTGVSLDDASSFTIDGASAEREIFEQDINEGDSIEMLGGQTRLTNAVVEGPVTRIEVDQVSGIARFAAGPLGDDPDNAEDDQFRLVDGDDTQTYRINGAAVSFSSFASALSTGDTVLYRRAANREHFELTNRPIPAVIGLVTESFDPDGSAVAPEPEDGGTMTVLTVTGRTDLAYTADAEYRIDGRLATEAEFEAERTPGDEVSYQQADPSSGTIETISLENGILSGQLADINEGDNTVDLITADGVLYDDLDFVAAIFGGDAEYAEGTTPLTLAEFEGRLRDIDLGRVEATLQVRLTSGDTVHRLTTG